MGIADGLVIEILGTYMNFQKLNAQQDAYACPVIWGWGWDLPLTGVAVEDFASGYTYTEDHRYYPEGGEFSWTLTLTFDDNVGFSGTIDAPPRAHARPPATARSNPAPARTDPAGRG